MEKCVVCGELRFCMVVQWAVGSYLYSKLTFEV